LQQAHFFFDGFEMIDLFLSVEILFDLNDARDDFNFSATVYCNDYFGSSHSSFFVF